MSASIHPGAIIEDGARLGDGVRIGPFCHVGPDVVLGDGTELISHVSITGATTLGENCRVHPHAALGGPPQNHAHKGGRTTLVVGAGTVIREAATLHTGSDSGRGETTIGEKCFLMAYSHVGHDCIVGQGVTLTNAATLGGHCEVGDHAIIGGLAAVHQFVRIGRRAFVAGCAAVVGDVIPFGMVIGDRAKLRGFNVVGLKRAGVSRSELHTLRAAYRLIFSPAAPMAQNAEQARERYGDVPAVIEIVDFLTSRGKRHFALPPAGRADADDDDGD